MLPCQRRRLGPPDPAWPWPDLVAARQGRAIVRGGAAGTGQRRLALVEGGGSGWYLMAQGAAAAGVEASAATVAGCRRLRQLVEPGGVFCAQATGSEVWWPVLLSSSPAMLVRRCLGGGAGGRMVLAGGVVVVLRAVPGFFRWRRCAGEEEQATGLAKNVRHAWCCRAKASIDAYVGGDGGYVLVASFFLLGALL